jgi:hypothetical protein
MRSVGLKTHTVTLVREVNAGVLPVEPRSLHKSVNTLEPYIPQVVAEFAGGITRVLPSAKRVQGPGGLAKGISGVAQTGNGNEFERVSRLDQRNQVKCTVKVWKPKRTKQKLVMGMDIGLEESCNLALCALVGRLAYRSRCVSPLDEWVLRSWEPLLGYSPEVLSLPRGWMGFVFKSPEDSELVLNKFWSYDGGSMMLKRWRISFNPVT